MAKFTDNDGNEVHILKDGIVVSVWQIDPKTTGSQIFVGGANHFVKEQIADVVKALGRRLEFFPPE